MAPKSNIDATVVNLMLPPPVDLYHIPLPDRDYKIVETKCEFDLFELRYWFPDTYLDQSDEINLWKSRLPLFVFPQSYYFPKLLLKCHASYLSSKRAIISPHCEILFTITSESINQMF